MSFDEINAFIEIMQEKEKEQYRYDVDMQYINAVFNNTEKPHEVYKKIINIDKKPQTNEQMENMARNLNVMLGGKTVKEVVKRGRSSS